MSDGILLNKMMFMDTFSFSHFYFVFGAGFDGSK